MDSEKARIQRLLEEGKITPDEARKLLTALEQKPRKKEEGPAERRPAARPFVIGGVAIALLILFLALFMRGRDEMNMLINPGLEKGVGLRVSSWTPSVSGSAFLGGPAVKETVFVWDKEVYRRNGSSISIDAGGGAGTGKVLSWRQSIKTFPRGKRLMLSGYVKTRDVPPEGSASLILRGLKALKQETLFATTAMSYDLTGTKDWTLVRVQAMVGEDTEEIQVLCALEGGGGGGRLWCDDLELRVVE